MGEIGSETVIRRMRSGELAAPEFGRSVWRLLHDLVVAGGALGWVTPPSEPEIAAMLTRLLACGDETAACVVAAVEGGELAGYGHWRRYQRQTTRQQVDLEILAVGADYQGRGLGRAVLRRLIAEARATPTEMITLDFRGDNSQAESLYLSEGFVEHGRIPGFVAVGGQRYDKVLHHLDLRG